MKTKVFLPKMTGFSENQVERTLDDLQKNYGLSDYNVLEARFWSAPHSNFLGTLIDPDNKTKRCSPWSKDIVALTKEHPDCELCTKNGVISLQVAN